MADVTRELFYSAKELVKFGFAEVGTNVRISRKASLYAISGKIGNNVRVDDFCILKGNIQIGSLVHIAAFCSISGVDGSVILEDCCTLAARVSVYTGSDDYRANALSSSVVPASYRVTISGDVVIGTASLVGAHSVILPRTRIGAAASIGALCSVHRNIPPGAIMVSDPPGIRIKGQRDVDKILDMAKEVLARSLA